MATKLIRYIEELAANAWPAAVMQEVDGWRLRFNWGVTRRANSVWPNQARGDHSLDEKLRWVEDFYGRWGGTARYQMCPAAQPAGLDRILAERGYTATSQTAIQIAPIAEVLARSRANLAHSVKVGDHFGEAWFATYCQAEGVSAPTAEIRRGILQRIGPRPGFALLEIDGEAVALGLGVVERGWLGVFSMATRPEFRRRGAATAVLQTLAEWGQQHQASHMYLQVVAENAPALALYGGLGFETLYHYYYREAQ